MKGRDRQVSREKRRDNWLGTPVPTFGTGTKNLNRESQYACGTRNPDTFQKSRDNHLLDGISRSLKKNYFNFGN